LNARHPFEGIRHFVAKTDAGLGRQWGQDENRHEDDLPEKGE
jgi:hypothetical protein